MMEQIKTITNGMMVSTVNLDEQAGDLVGFVDLVDGLMGFGGGRYETMVFTVDTEGEVTDWGEQDLSRYDSEDEAITGHAVMVAKWEATDDN